MGASQSNYDDMREMPDKKATATLYYFGGRGLADQLRWLMAATDVTFVQKVIDSREKFTRMVERQLPFGQLPLLQIDGLEIVQTQAAIKYLARRANIHGRSAAEELKCEMIQESIRDLITLLASAPMQRSKSAADATAHNKVMKDKWLFIGSRYESIFAANNNSDFMVGASMTYVDILMAHVLTWFVEECGPEVVANMPRLIGLQNRILSQTGVCNFIRNDKLYYPLSDEKYILQVKKVLAR